MRIFKSRPFHQWARSKKIDDRRLIQAVEEIGEGLFETSLGSNLYKKRVARKGQGKRGGFRILVAFKKNDLAVFMFGFAKNEQGNISKKEEFVYKKLAKYFLETSDIQINLLMTNGELFEVKNEKNKEG